MTVTSESVHNQQPLEANLESNDKSYKSMGIQEQIVRACKPLGTRYTSNVRTCNASLRPVMHMQYTMPFDSGGEEMGRGRGC